MTNSSTLFGVTVVTSGTYTNNYIISAASDTEAMSIASEAFPDAKSIEVINAMDFLILNTAVLPNSARPESNRQNTHIDNAARETSMTYDEIKIAAFAYLNRMGGEGKATIEAHIEEFFSRKTPEEKAVFVDNLILDYYGFSLVDNAWHYSCEDIRKVYEAAKVIFARHPGKQMTYDLDSAASFCGSPWVASCDTPEEWTINFARLRVQNDEASISGPITDETVSDVKELLVDLKKIGIDQQHILDNLSTICWGRYVLEHKVIDTMGWEQLVPKREPEQWEIEEEKEREAA